MFVAGSSGKISAKRRRSRHRRRFAGVVGRRLRVGETDSSVKHTTKTFLIYGTWNTVVVGWKNARKHFGAPGIALIRNARRSHWRPRDLMLLNDRKRTSTTLGTQQQMRSGGAWKRCTAKTPDGRDECDVYAAV